MAFDFDDMEAEAEARLAEGDDSARLLLGAPDPPAPWRGGTLPPMRNLSNDATRHVPSRQDLHKYLQPLKLEITETFNTRVRLFVFYGAGDSAAAWVQLVNQVPSWIDLAIFERRGHGQRSSEPFSERLVDDAKDAFEALKHILEDHAKGGSFEGAPFALLGHSMGCQVMIEVALLLKQTLGLEPAALFALDRGAPHVALYSAEGYRLLLERPEEFFQGFNPLVYKLMQRPDAKENKDTQRMINMWKTDCRLSQEHLWPEGHHIFHCDLHVVRAQKNFLLDTKKDLTEELQRVQEINCRITNSGPRCSAPWSPESYDAWAQWSTEPCQVHDIDAEHMAVKLHAHTVRLITDVLQRKASPRSV
ncbi:unnamed protein product [Effrenium voratum]|nr:unnamed protein product [Effrenium voratum]